MKVPATLLVLCAVWGVAAAEPHDRAFHLGVTAMPPARANPFRSAGVTSSFVLPSIYDSLAAVDNDGKLRPRLAVSWRAMDVLTWEFKLRDGVNARTVKI